MLFFPTVRISKADSIRLMQLAFDLKTRAHPAVALLRSEVHRAILYDEPTANFVQLDRLIRYQLDKNPPEERVLVRPDDYRSSELHLSVLTSLGAALIGLRVGDSMPFLCSDGDLHLVTPLNGAFDRRVNTGSPSVLMNFIYLYDPVIAAMVAGIWILFSFVVAAAAKRRGRNGIGWFVFAILLSPPFVGIFLLVFSPLVMPSTVNDAELRRNIQRGVGSGEP